MKKFLLSLCAIAVTGACLFMTSCKDDDDPIIYNNIKQAIENAKDADAVYTYSVTVNGVVTEFDNLQDVQTFFEGLAPETQYTITVTEVKGGQSKTATSGGQTPSPGENATGTVAIPSIDDDTIKYVEFEMKSTHNGGAVN